MNYDAVIAAVSTPPGKGGVAIIRVSGEGALDVASKVFVPKGKKALSEIPPRTQIFGNVIYQGEEIDDGLLCYFKAPASYTGEDTVEISCHGGTLITKTVLEALFAAGARPALAGEFTRRALINGKLSLTDAEAVANLLEAKTEAQIMLGAEGSRNHLSREISEIRESLSTLLSSMWARIDYPEEDLGDFSDEELSEKLLSLDGRIKILLDSYKTGRAVNEGIKTTICGKPNAGKSSLYNLILGEDRAIVTDIPGTTRDVLSAEVALGKTLLLLSDTAGIRNKSDDKIELIGIERSKEAIKGAELIIALFDGSSEFSPEDEDIISALDATRVAKIAIINKCDLAKVFPKEKLEGRFDKILEISALKSSAEARALLGKEIDSLFTDEKITLGKSAVIQNARQFSSLLRAKEFIDSAKNALAKGLTQDLASADVEKALGEIRELDGKRVTDEVLDKIFANFCVGK